MRIFIAILIGILTVQCVQWKANAANASDAACTTCSSAMPPGVDDDSMPALLQVVRGTSLRKREKYAEALESLNETVKRFPNCSNAYVQRAFVYQQSGWDESGEQSYRDANHAIQLDATNALAFILRGNALREQEQYSNAIADYGQAIELNPDSYSAYFNRAVVHYWTDNSSQAKEDLVKAISLDPPAADREPMQEALERFQE